MFTDVVDPRLERLRRRSRSSARACWDRLRAALGLPAEPLWLQQVHGTEVFDADGTGAPGRADAAVTHRDDRVLAFRGKADRVDLLEDGTFRLIDYKLGWPPNRARALQLPIYSICAEQQLASHRGRNWTLGEAAYLAFKGPRRVVPLFSSAADRNKVLAEAQQRLADTLDAIDAGQFPPKPDDVYRCETCTYAVVCRKDYVGEV
jgi:RecB family exonuclease